MEPELRSPGPEDPASSSKPRQAAWSRLLRHPATRATVGAALILLLMLTGRLDVTVLRKVTLGWPLFWLIAATVVGFAATSLRWISLVRALGRNGSGLVAAGLGTNVLAYLAPAGAGTDAARVVHLSRGRVCGPGEAAAIGLMDRLMGVQCLLVVGALVGVAAGVTQRNGLMAWGLGVGMAILIIGPYCFLRLGCRLPANGPLRAVRSAADRLQARVIPGWLAAAWFSSAVAALANGVLPWLAVSVFTPLSMSSSTVLSSVLVVLVNGAAPTPGGIGAGEAAAAALFTQTAPGAAGMLLVRTVGVLVSLFLAGAWLLRGTSREPVPATSRSYPVEGAE